MIKRVMIAAVLGIALSAAAFAQHHPGGWGIGAVIQGGGAWRGGGAGVNGLALSLKAPQMPVYWGINADFFRSNWFGIGATGDYYVIDQALIPDIGLGWYFGIGGYGNLGFYTGSYNYSQFTLGVGVRIPVGLSFIIARQFEFFVDFAPSLGLGFGLGDYYDQYNEKNLWLDGGWAGDLGFRIWLK